MQKIIYFLLALGMTSCHTVLKKSKTAQYAFLEDSLKMNQQLMEHDLAGLSLVVFEDYQVVYSSQWGLKAANSYEKIDEHTAFSTASISKPVTALLCHILDEKGLIDLDDPISLYLERWHLPKSPFIENNPPNWKHFLNHTSGTTQHGFADFYEGENIPGLRQSLLGELPRYDKEIEFTFSPGSSWQYSGGGYVIIQMALEDFLDRSLASLAEEYVFEPLNMKNTTMYQPNEPGFLTNVALVHDDTKQVIKTGLPITPQVAASGMWSTPTDLAKLSIEIQRALRNEDNKVISHKVAKNLIEVSALKDAVGGWSNGWQRSFGFHNFDWFMHNGSNNGVGGDVFATVTGGNGFVFLANGEKENRFPVIDHTRKKILSLMAWKKKIPEKQLRKIPDSIRESLIGTYNDFLYGQDFQTRIVEKNDQLYVESPFFEHFLGNKQSKMVYLKNGYFKILDYPNRIRFHFEDGVPISATVSKDNAKIEVPLSKNL